MGTHVADKVTATNNDVKRVLHPEGQFPALCVDVVALGDRVEEYSGKPKRLTPKCAIVFRTGEFNEETGEMIDMSGEYTVAMGELANLRKLLEQWRGRPYTEEQIREGVSVDRLVGNWTLLSVAHKKSAAGRTRAVIQAAVPLPRQMKRDLPEFPAYSRPTFWAERKAEYLEGARKFRAEIGAPAPDEDHSFPGEDLMDDLPF